MNIGTVVSALEFVVTHRKEIASEAEAAIHFIRRVEHLCVKHETTADHVLVCADNMLTAIRDAQETGATLHTQT